MLQQEQEIRNPSGASILDERLLQLSSPSPHADRRRGGGPVRAAGVQSFSCRQEVLQVVFDAGHELIGDRAVNEPVVVDLA